MWGGYGFKSIIETCKEDLSTLGQIGYVGVDLINLEQTLENLRLFTQASLPHSNCSITLLNSDITDIPGDEKFDLVLALGSLHHTPSVSDSLTSTYTRLKPGGAYIGWIIGEQKPLRATTDRFFRDFFGDVSKRMHQEQDSYSLAQLFLALGEALGEKQVTLDQKVFCLDIEPGTYKLQTLLYDYVIKCYFKSGNSPEGLARIQAQLFDWFAPAHYHQTSRADLEALLEGLEGSTQISIVTKINGHFFHLVKGT